MEFPKVKTPPEVGVGLGLRRSFMDVSRDLQDDTIDFWEFAPENWIGVGGRWGRMLRQHTERFPCVLHGLCLSLGGYAPLDEEFLFNVRDFMKEYGIAYYSEHLSFCGDDAPLYELLPIPFTQDAAINTAERIMRTQDILGVRIAVENPSYYMATAEPDGEVDFLLDVLKRSGCKIMLDVNNCYVNSHNHNGNPKTLIDKLERDDIAYIHVAGHRHGDDNVIIDSHGADVQQPVWDLLSYTYNRLGPIATLIERDSNIPDLPQLLTEINRVRGMLENPALSAVVE